VDAGAWMAPKIIKRASSRMPTPELQARYREEWLAELDALDGLKLIKLAKAIGLWANSWRIGRAWQSDPSAALTPTVRRLIRGIASAAVVAWTGEQRADPSARVETEGPGVSRLFNARFVLLCFLLVTVPANKATDLVLSFPDGSKFNVAISPGAGCPSKYAAWLIPLTRMLAVIFYDIYLLRRGTPLMSIPRYHSEAYKSYQQ
jgi:hypothetical protein